MSENSLTLTPRAKRALLVAENFARDADHGYIGTEHLLMALFESMTITRGHVTAGILENCGVDGYALFPQLLVEI